ncbi:MAG: YkgJ family cysteine cluster protein [Acidobacteria bacterium]|nr:YkgJ family cysteine cluster protein [Acidobacteriota bacterium]
MLDPFELSRFKEAILAQAKRLGPDDKFHFACHPKLGCFNSCCANVNVYLMPYDVLRLKRRLGIDSRSFLERHAIADALDTRGLPIVQLRMTEDEKKRCPFVTEAGCSVYEDRPWACRMYPIGGASPPAGKAGAETFYFVVERFESCAGFDEDREWSVAEWKENQGVAEYEAKSEAFKAISLHPFFVEQRRTLPLDKSRMLLMACYDLDTFRKFVFETSFLRRFEISPEIVERLRADDEALLIFAYRWLRFGLFGEPTLTLAPQEVEGKIEGMGKMFTR